MICFPNAKINIGLNITERRPDGYHNIETLFFPVPLTDALEIVVRNRGQKGCMKLHTHGIAIEGKSEENLVSRAYHLLAADFELPPVDIHLYKNIPLGAGLGGGSSDAAFTLKMLNDICSLGLSPQAMEQYAARLGADCPFFIHNAPVFATGIGNEFTPIDSSLHGYTLILIKPAINVSTRDAYAGVKPAPANYSLRKMATRPVEEWRKVVVNDFEKSVFAQYPKIGIIKEQLYEAGAVYASMSGSGSSVFALFKSGTLPQELIRRFAGDFCFKCELE